MPPIEALLDLATCEALRREHRRAELRAALPAVERKGSPAEIAAAREQYADALDSAVSAQKTLMAALAALGEDIDEKTQPATVEGKVVARGLTLVPTDADVERHAADPCACGHARSEHPFMPTDRPGFIGAMERRGCTAQWCTCERFKYPVAAGNDGGVIHDRPVPGVR